MSYIGLLNKRCSWTRREKYGKDVYRQPLYSDVVKGSDVRCRVEKDYGFDIWEGEPGGDFARVVTILFLPTGEDIQPNDIVTIEGSDNYKVIDDDNFALMDHHIECRVEKTTDL